MILRNCVWLRPPQPPTRMDRIDNVSNRLGLMLVYRSYRTDSGASFCQVSRIRPGNRGMPWVVSGTQKWKGERPSFIARARVRIVEAVGLVILVVVHWLESSRLVITASISSMDAVVWVRKYLVAASVERGWWVFVSIGMTASMFISKPIHTISQCELVITMVVPKIIVDIIVVETRGFISMGGI